MMKQNIHNIKKIQQYLVLKKDKLAESNNSQKKIYLVTDVMYSMLNYSHIIYYYGFHTTFQKEKY